MRKLFSQRIEVVTGILAAVVVLGILAVYGSPALGIAEAKSAITDGFKALSPSASGSEGKVQNAKNGDCKLDFGMCPKMNKASLAVAGTGPACDGDKDGDKKSANGMCPKTTNVLLAAANAGPACDGDKDGDKKSASGICAKTANAMLASAGTAPGCDGDKGCDKKSGNAICPKSASAATIVAGIQHQCNHPGCPLHEVEARVASLKAAGLGCCGGPAQAPAVTKDAPGTQLAKAE